MATTRPALRVVVDDLPGEGVDSSAVLFDWTHWLRRAMLDLVAALDEVGDEDVAGSLVFSPRVYVIRETLVVPRSRIRLVGNQTEIQYYPNADNDSPEEIVLLQAGRLTLEADHTVSFTPSPGEILEGNSVEGIRLRNMVYFERELRDGSWVPVLDDGLVRRRGVGLRMVNVRRASARGLSVYFTRLGVSVEALGVEVRDVAVDLVHVSGNEVGVGTTTSQGGRIRGLRLGGGAFSGNGGDVGGTWADTRSADDIGFQVAWVESYVRLEGTVSDVQMEGCTFEGSPRVSVELGSAVSCVVMSGVRFESLNEQNGLQSSASMVTLLDCSVACGNPKGYEDSDPNWRGQAIRLENDAGTHVLWGSLVVCGIYDQAVHSLTNPWAEVGVALAKGSVGPGCRVYGLWHGWIPGPHGIYKRLTT